MSRKEVITNGLISFEGKVLNITKSVIPNVNLIEIIGDEISLKMDMIKNLLTVKTGDKVSIEISRKKPDYEEGRDFVAHGYVMTKKKEGNVNKVLISIWGYLLILTSKDEKLLSAFDYIDKVYIKISK